MNNTVFSSLSGKVAFVTGGSRGIGAGIAQAFANAGATVALSYHGNKGLAETIVNEIASLGRKAIAVPLSSGDRQSTENAIEAITKEVGAPDILVNNAALAQEKPFESLSDTDWQNMMAVNLLGPVQTIQSCLPAMQNNNWGRIINISSIGGQWGGERQVHYAASKAALINLTMSMARLYSKHGITCNAIAPGLVPTDMTAKELSDESSKQKIQSIPAQRLGQIDEVAGTCLFLCADDAAYITGQTLNLNGGMYFG